MSVLTVTTTTTVTTVSTVTIVANVTSVTTFPSVGRYVGIKAKSFFHKPLRQTNQQTDRQTDNQTSRAAQGQFTYDVSHQGGGEISQFVIFPTKGWDQGSHTCKRRKKTDYLQALPVTAPDLPPPLFADNLFEYGQIFSSCIKN